MAAPAPRVTAVLEVWMIPLAIAKGLVMAVLILGIAEVGFLESLVLAVSSATVTGIFLVLATYVQARHTGRKVDEVASKVETVAETVEAPNGH